MQSIANYNLSDNHQIVKNYSNPTKNNKREYFLIRDDNSDRNI
jgi:hypothetical protein